MPGALTSTDGLRQASHLGNEPDPPGRAPFRRGPSEVRVLAGRRLGKALPCAQNPVVDVGLLGNAMGEPADLRTVDSDVVQNVVVE